MSVINERVMHCHPLSNSLSVMVVQVVENKSYWSDDQMHINICEKILLVTFACKANKLSCVSAKSQVIELIVK